MQPNAQQSPYTHCHHLLPSIPNSPQPTPFFFFLLFPQFFFSFHSRCDVVLLMVFHLPITRPSFIPLDCNTFPRSSLPANRLLWIVALPLLVSTHHRDTYPYLLAQPLYHCQQSKSQLCAALLSYLVLVLHLLKGVRSADQPTLALCMGCSPCQKPEQAHTCHWSSCTSLARRHTFNFFFSLSSFPLCILRFALKCCVYVQECITCLEAMVHLRCALTQLYTLYYSSQVIRVLEDMKGG